MSATGYTPLQPYYSTTATNVPLAANMVTGELAINTVDGKLYFKNSSGVVTLLASTTTVINSFSAGTTGLTPNTATTGAVTLAGTLITSNGGTGLSSWTAGDIGYYASGTALSKLSIGATGTILTSTGTGPQWSSSSVITGDITARSFYSTGAFAGTYTDGIVMDYVTGIGRLTVGSGDGITFYNGGTGASSSIGSVSSTGAWTLPSVTDSALTTGRVTYAGTAGLLTDSANLTFDGTKLTVGNILDSGLTASQAVFSDASKNLVSNAITGTGNVVMSASPTLTGTAGFAALTASADSAFNGTGALQLPVGTTAQQPTGAIGKLRFNSTTSQFEGYTGSAWSSVGGSALSNDTTTATNLYPLFATATTGTALNVYTSNAKYLYKPSTGDLQSSQLIANNGLVLNNATVSASYTIATGNNAMSVGPMTVASGQTVTVSTGQRWVIL